MKRETLPLLAVFTLVGLAPLGVSDAPVDEDRSFDYLGTARYDHGLQYVCDVATGDCPLLIPDGISHTECDHSDGILPLSEPPVQWHGIGGGTFCHIRKETTVTVTVHDMLLENPQGIVTCPWHVAGPRYPDLPLVGPVPGPDGVSGYNLIGEADPSLTFEVPEDCWSPPRSSDKDELTEISVFMNVGDGTTGTVTLEHHE